MSDTPATTPNTETEPWITTWIHRVRVMFRLDKAAGNTDYWDGYAAAVNDVEKAASRAFNRGVRISSGSDALLREAFQKVRRQYVGLPEEGADSVDAAIAEALNAAEEAIRAALDATKSEPWKLWHERDPRALDATNEPERCPDCKLTADQIGRIHINAQIAARVSASVDREDKP